MSLSDKSSALKLAQDYVSLKRTLISGEEVLMLAKKVIALSSGERSLCPENMQPCDMGCSGGWCVTLHGSPSVAAAHTDTDAIRSRQLSGIAARVAKVERSSTPPEALALPEWAKDLESCWAEWTGGHITTDTFARCVSEIVTSHIIPAGYPTPDSIPVADILRLSVKK